MNATLQREHIENMRSDEPQIIMTPEEFLELQKNEPELAIMAEIRMMPRKGGGSVLRFIIGFNSFFAPLRHASRSR